MFFHVNGHENATHQSYNDYLMFLVPSHTDWRQKFFHGNS